MLADAQARLEGHFATLAQQRAKYRYPVYALEHGLEPSDIRAIRLELASTRNLKREHWLLWIAVAAEIGYVYDGDEFWISFAARIPNWGSFGSRDTIRDWFRTFAARFAGFAPGGRWARHFTIIAWPITHSILPRYLQPHFAAHLYALRYHVAQPDGDDIGQLGELIRDRYHGASSRFREFLQQTELTARLVLALRDEDVQDAVAPIYRGTLARLVSDLERGRSARWQLHEARRVLRNARIQGISGLTGSASPRRESHGQKTRVGKAGAAKLVARCSSAGSWTVGVALPDFAAMLRLTGVDRRALDKTRLRFLDKPTRWMPARTLLSYAGQDHALARLPESLHDPIIALENPIPRLSEILAADVRLQGSPPWLLRVHEDGIARQVLGNHVRTNRSYVVVAQDAVDPALASELALEMRDCVTDRLVLYTMDTPPTIGDGYRLALERLNFGYALRATVETVGLTPRWDEVAGGSIWLPHEEIVLRLSADFEVAELSVSLNDQQCIRVPVSAGADAFVSVGPLPVGRHMVVVAAHSATISAVATEPEILILEVRPPEPWHVSAQRYAGFRIVIDPPDATIEALLTNRASISVHGPPGRHAVVDARLFDPNGHPLERAELGQLMIPHAPEAMRRVVEKLGAEPLSEQVLGAPRVDIVATVEELGAASVSFGRKIDPLRWKLERRDAEYIARLIDDAGLPSDALVERHPMEAPGERIALKLHDCINGILVDPPGSLFVASYEQRLYAAIASVPPRTRITDLAHLGFSISLPNVGGKPDPITRLLALCKRWRVARPLGKLASIRKAHLIGAFDLAVARLACGADWANRARDCRLGQIMLLPLLQREVGGSPGFASRMRTTAWPLTKQSTARFQFSQIAKHYQISDDADLCDIAFRLAFSPTKLGVDDLSQRRALLEQLIRNRPLARGAFLAKLSADIGTGVPRRDIADATA